MTIEVKREKMKKITWLILVLLLCVGVSIWAVEKGKPEVSHQGKDPTPVQACEMLFADPEHTFLIDCRTMAEYELVGHPPMAYNIPVKFWTSKRLKLNPDFVQDVQEKFKKKDKLILISRSGKRSRLSCNLLAKAGFGQVFNVLGGFEGDKVKKRGSANFGYRRQINGWQHDRLPYTYDLKKKLVYKLHTSCGCE